MIIPTTCIFHLLIILSFLHNRNTQSSDIQIIDGDTAKVLSTLDIIYQEGSDLKLFVDKFLEFCVEVEKYIICGDCSITKIPAVLEETLKNSINFKDADNYYLYILNKLLDLKNNSYAC